MRRSRTIPLLVVAVSLCCPTTEAAADALYGKKDQFRAGAVGLVTASSELVVAVRCGLRSQPWAVLVNRTIESRLTTLATETWPESPSARFGALAEIDGLIQSDMRLALRSV